MTAALGSSKIADDLEWALSKAVRDANIYHVGLAERILEITGQSGANGAIASLEYCGLTGKPEPAGCLRADPVHLITNLDHLALSNPAELNLDQPEAEALVADITGRLAEDSWQLYALKPDAWYLISDEVINMDTSPVRDVIGKSIFNYLPKGPDALRWQKLQIEFQAVLHTSEVNKQREKIGKLPVNSLWFWGQGQRETDNNPDWHLWGKHPVLRGLEISNNFSRKSLPDNITSWLAGLDTGKHLIVLDEHKEPADLNNAVNIIQTLLLAIKTGKIDALQLASNTGPTYTITRSNLLRFIFRYWRSSKKLSDYFLE